MYTITTKKYGDQVLPPLLYEAWQKADFQKNRYAFLWANCREDVLVVIDWVQYGAKDVKDKALLLISLLSKSKFAKFTDNARKWLSEKKTQVKNVAKKIVDKVKKKAQIEPGDDILERYRLEGETAKEARKRLEAYGSFGLPW